MESITVQEFNTRLNSAGEIAVFQDLLFPFDFSINKENCKSKRLSFENCEFEKAIAIENIDLNLGFIFKHCFFHDYLIIQGVVVSEHYSEFKNDHRNNSLFLSDCKIDKSLLMNSNLFLRDMCIEDSTIYQLDIDNLTSQEGGFIIKKSIIEYYVTMGQCHFLDSIRFIEVNCKNSLRFTNNNALSYLFSINTFDSDSWIWYGKLKEGISINGGNYKAAFIVQSVDASGGLSIDDAKFEAGVSISYESKNGNNLMRFGFPKIYIRDSEFNYGLNISGKRFTNENFPIELINIHATKLLKGEIYIGGFEVLELIISGTVYDANLIFNDNKFVKVLLERLTNFGTIHFLNTSACSKDNVTNEFLSSNSHLGKTYFTNVTFDGFDNISIEDSNFSEIIASNVKWFEIRQLEKPNELKHLNRIQKIKRGLKYLVNNVDAMNPELAHYRRKRELFRQLKHSMHQQGNTIQSLVFKQYEMIFFTNELRLSKSLFNKDRLIMELSVTNAHGQNWIKPLLLLTLLVTPLFGCLLIIVKNSGFDNFLSNICSNKHIFVYLLNPTFSLKDIFGEHIFSGYLMAVSIFYRAVYAFFLFQIISAFRKFIK